jgi:hypothetical protein
VHISPCGCVKPVVRCVYLSVLTEQFESQVVPSNHGYSRQSRLRIPNCTQLQSICQPANFARDYNTSRTIDLDGSPIYPRFDFALGHGVHKVTPKHFGRSPECGLEHPLHRPLCSFYAGDGRRGVTVHGVRDRLSDLSIPIGDDRDRTVWGLLPLMCGWSIRQTLEISRRKGIYRRCVRMSSR